MGVDFRLRKIPGAPPSCPYRGTSPGKSLGEVTSFMRDDMNLETNCLLIERQAPGICQSADTPRASINQRR
jgi:hypothetical protein